MKAKVQSKANSWYNAILPLILIIFSLLTIYVLIYGESGYFAQQEIQNQLQLIAKQRDFMQEQLIQNKQLLFRLLHDRATIENELYNLGYHNPDEIILKYNNEDSPFQPSQRILETDYTQIFPSTENQPVDVVKILLIILGILIILLIVLYIFFVHWSGVANKNNRINKSQSAGNGFASSGVHPQGQDHYYPY